MSNESEARLAERLKSKLHRLFVALIFVFVIVGGFRPVMDNVDIGWHVAQGRWMVEHAAFYREDALNYPNLGHPVIDEYPLFQVVLYAVWRLGWWGPCLLTALIYALVTFLLIRADWFLNRKTSSLSAMAIFLMLNFFLAASPLRPHVATYLGVTLLGIFLLRHRDATNWTAFWPVALLQIAWTNSHSGFVLGPAMVGLFGFEIIARHWLNQRFFPWTTISTWLGGFLLIFLSCLINPYGWARFGPPFYQDRLESIRAYVGEMQPLDGGLATIYGDLTVIAAIVVALAIFRSRGAVSFSFLLFALFFYEEAQSVKKAWPVFGLFVPLVVLSSGVFTSHLSARKPMDWLGVLGYSIVSVLLGLALYLELNSSFPWSVPVLWREHNHGRSELSLRAVEWMKAHGVEGRLFHRCEDGGWFQEAGFDHGETFGDTGFGKYDEAFIHENGLVEERPALVPRFLNAYRPDFAVCSTFCFQWPYYLRQSGWRLIFYSPNSSVWARPGVRTDLPAQSEQGAIMDAFDHDVAAYNLPDARLYGRNLIALNSLGLEDFAYAKLKSLPSELHHAPWYWEAARILCFAEPRFSDAHRNELQTEAEALRDDTVTAEFRAYCHESWGHTDQALQILEAIAKNQLGNYSAELLLKIYLDRKRHEALPLARRTDCWDLRNGHHWQYLAQAEDQAGNQAAAARAWQKAVFYYPDDVTLMEAATAFASRTKDATLLNAIEESAKVYGQR